MGQVFKAEHLLMRRIVALKMIARNVACRMRANGCDGVTGDGSGLPAFCSLHAAFLREVEAAAQLHHPNIVTAYDADQDRGVLFLAMEYVEGIDLDRLVASTGPLPVALACAVIRQTAEALQYAHERGLVHRDVKPSNLILTQPYQPPCGATTPVPSGRSGACAAVVKLLDLGLARWTPARARQAFADSAARTEDALDGTPDYMAPERGHSEHPTDIRSDLYSLGCTFYFLLTGQVPYPGGSWMEKLLRHRLDTPVPVEQLRPEVPREVAAIMRRLMAPAAEDRYATPAEVVAALQERGMSSVSPLPGGGEKAPAGRPVARVAVPSASARLRRPFALLVAVLSGLLLAWGARWAWPHQGARRPGAPKTASLPENGRVSFVVEGVPGSFATLAEAVARAPDCGTVIVQGTGTVGCPPLRTQGKALTVRAAVKDRPCLEMTAPASPSWPTLLTTDRPLTLEGLELRHPGARSGDPSTLAELGPLLSCEQASLRLVNCRLSGRGPSPLIVVRNAPQATLERCWIDAEAVGLSVEVGKAPCRLQLQENTFTDHGASGVALSLWAPEVRLATPVELRLDRNTFRAGRVLALRALPSSLAITAVSNGFTFREGLLGYVAYPSGDSWRRSTTWQGRDNCYDSAGPWLRIEGQATAVRDLAAWCILWNMSEPQSREKRHLPSTLLEDPQTTLHVEEP
jgi:hypothetical protein